MSTEQHHSHESDQDAWWIARPENTETIWRLLVGACVVLVLADLIYHNLHHKHGHFVFESAIGFHAAYGFVAFIVVVLSGKKLRNVLMRNEDYYDVPYVPRVDDHGHDSHGHDSHGHDSHGHDSHGHGGNGHEPHTSKADDGIESLQGEGAKSEEDPPSAADTDAADPKNGGEQ